MSKVEEEYKKQLEHAEYHNRMAPFPVYDTDYIEEIKNKIKDMIEKKEEIDALPVVACKYCKSLWVENDELENEICMRCGSENDTIILPNINEYLSWKEDE